MKPSTSLYQHFERECQTKCQKFNYWWAGKASHVAWNMMSYDTCIQKCIRKTIKEQRPTKENSKD